MCMFAVKLCILPKSPWELSHCWSQSHVDVRGPAGFWPNCTFSISKLVLDANERLTVWLYSDLVFGTTSLSSDKSCLLCLLLRESGSRVCWDWKRCAGWCLQRWCSGLLPNLPDRSTHVHARGLLCTSLGPSPGSTISVHEWVWSQTKFYLICI